MSGPVQGMPGQVAICTIDDCTNCDLRQNDATFRVRAFFRHETSLCLNPPTPPRPPATHAALYRLVYVTRYDLIHSKLQCHF